MPEIPSLPFSFPEPEYDKVILEVQSQCTNTNEMLDFLVRTVRALDKGRGRRSKQEISNLMYRAHYILSVVAISLNWKEQS